MPSHAVPTSSKPLSVVPSQSSSSALQSSSSAGPATASHAAVSLSSPPVNTHVMVPWVAHNPSPTSQSAPRSQPSSVSPSQSSSTRLHGSNARGWTAPR